MKKLSITVKQLLENKDIKPKEEYLDIIENRWKYLQVLRRNLEHINIDDADISLRNIPGGDHVE